MNRAWINLGLAVALAALLCGCYQVEDDLTLNADGSGTVELTTIVAASVSTFDSDLIGIYPPVTEESVRDLFPEKDFKVNTEVELADDGSTHLKTKAAFKNADALLKSPYGKVHALNLTVETNVLQLRAISGMAWLSRRAAGTNTDEITSQIAGWSDLQKKSNQMRFSFKVTLPKPITSGNGASQGQAVSWAVEAAKKSLAESAQFLNTPMEAACSAEGLTFTPKPTVRFNATTFNALPGGSLETASGGPDEKAILQAAKFRPKTLTITRTIAYSGFFGGQNQSVLQGELVLPREMAPLQQGVPTVTEVQDNLGNDLTPPRAPKGQQRPDFQGNNPGRKTGKEYRQPVNLQLMIPNWNATEITKLDATIDLNYFGGLQVLKITNAIKADWISSTRDLFNTRTISDPQLAKAGIKLSCSSQQLQLGRPTLEFRFQGSETVVMDAQLYDSSGNPVPQVCLPESQSLMQRGWSVLIPEQVTGPLSLALQTKGGKTQVVVPIHLEHVPVSDALKKP